MASTSNATELSVQAYYADSFALYVDELELVASEIRTDARSIKPLTASHIFSKLLSATNDKATLWNNLRGALLSVWRDPRHIRSDLVPRADLPSIVRLFQRVGHRRLSKLDREDRDEAICWLRALTDATNEFNEQAQDSQQISSNSKAYLVAKPEDVFVASDIKNASGWAAPPPTGAFVPPVTASTSTRNLAVVLNRRPLPATSVAESKTTAAPNKNDREDSLSDVPDETRLSPPRDDDDNARKRQRSVSSSDASEVPQKKTATRKKRSSLFREDDEYPAKRGKRASTSGALKYLTSSAPRTPHIDRPRRDRKIPTRLLASPGSESPDWHLPPSTGSTGTSTTQKTDWRVGQSLWAFFPNYGWWPSIVCPPDESILPAGLKTQGKRVGDSSLLVKSIPTGGDWRWLSPASMRILERDEAEGVMSRLPPQAPKMWKRYYADLVEGLIIALDEDRLKEWASKRTETEEWLAREQARKRESRVWKPTAVAVSDATNEAKGADEASGTASPSGHDIETTQEGHP